MVFEGILVVVLATNHKPQANFIMGLVHESPDVRSSLTSLRPTRSISKQNVFSNNPPALQPRSTNNFQYFFSLRLVMTSAIASAASGPEVQAVTGLRHLDGGIELPSPKARFLENRPTLCQHRPQAAASPLLNVLS